MSELDPGPLRERFQIDPADELALARLRLVAAGLAAAAAIAMLLSALPFVMVLLAVLALLVSLGWWGRARRLSKRAKNPEEHYLALYERGLMSADGAQRVWVAWKEVTHIDVDEERLEIVVQRGTAEPIRLEPRFPGLEIHELMHRLRNAWRGDSDHGETR